MESSAQRVEKRNRPPVSCEPCRTRKLKCDRQLPCSTCIKRHKQTSCCYSPNADRQKLKATAGQSNIQTLSERLKSVEESVSALFSTSRATELELFSSITESASRAQISEIPLSVSTPKGYFSPESTQNDPKEEPSHLVHDRNGRSIYIEPNHWMSILQDIKEIRAGLSTDLPHDHTFTNDPWLGPDANLSFGFHDNSITIEDILESVPPQPTCDVLLSQYFKSHYMVLGIVHPESFQIEYEKFWLEPTKSSPIWLALFFSTLSVAIALQGARVSAGNSDPTPSTPSVKTLQQRSAQCLVLGGYKNAQRYALEALILYAQSCLISGTKTAAESWFDLGVIVRLAFRLGYHRDPAGFPSISVFEGEMRRRVWIHIFQVETIMSFHMGLPSMIPTEYCDTENPRNLQHTDLHPDMTSLPASRPLSEYTPLRYALVKFSLINMFRKIVTHTQSLASPRYSQILGLDRELRETYEKLPIQVKRRDVNRSFMDTSDLILERCTLELLYLKGIVVLHRRYIQHEPHNGHFEVSRRSCLDAALEILARQADIHQACLPGGRLYEDRWMVSTLTTHDFLLAAMVVCLDLSVRKEINPGPYTSMEEENFSIKKLRALEASQQVWASNSHLSREAHLASVVLDLMINQGVFVEKDLPTFEDQAQSLASEQASMRIMSGMIDGSETVDWDILDQIFQNRAPSLEFSDR